MSHITEHFAVVFAQQAPVQYPTIGAEPFGSIEGSSSGFVVGVFVGIALTKYILK